MTAREYYVEQQRYRRLRQWDACGIPRPRPPEPSQPLSPQPEYPDPPVVRAPEPPPPRQPEIRPPAPPSFRLRAQGGDPAHDCLPDGTQFQLRIGQISIGRGPGSAIRLDDRHVSHHHADLLVAPGRLTIVDHGSTNGTFVNDVRISEPTPLWPGDAVHIGHDVLVVDLVESGPW